MLMFVSKKLVGKMLMFVSKKLVGKMLMLVRGMLVGRLPSESSLRLITWLFVVIFCRTCKFRKVQLPLSTQSSSIITSGRSRGVHPACAPPMGPDSFILTWQNFRNIATLGVHGPPLWGPCPLWEILDPPLITDTRFYPPNLWVIFMSALMYCFRLTQ